MKFSTILLAAFVGIASAADTPTPKNDLSCPLMCVRNAIVLSNNAFGATSRALCRIISKDESMDKCLAKCTEYSMSGGGNITYSDVENIFCSDNPLPKPHRRPHHRPHVVPFWN